MQVQYGSPEAQLFFRHDLEVQELGFENSPVGGSLRSCQNRIVVVGGALPSLSSCY